MRVLALIVASLLPLPALAQDARVRLRLVPDATATLAVVLEHDPGWHTYWLNPGDSGQATRLAWKLPPGATVRATHWPAPQRFDAGGGVTNYVYADATRIPVELDGVAPHARIALSAKWLECTKDVCVPGGGNAELELPPAASAHGAAHTPRVVDWPAHARIDGDAIEIVIAHAVEPTPVDAFPLQPQVLETAPPRIERRGDALIVRATRSEYFTAAPARLDLVLTAPGSGAWQVAVEFTSPSTSQGESR